MGKTTKIQVLRSNYPVKPPSEMLDEGVIAINNRLKSEKIYFKSEDGTNLVEFDPTYIIMEQVDDKIQNTNIGDLQNQVDIINGGENVDGSFEHADKVLENKLTPLINDKISDIYSGSGIKLTKTNDGSNKTVKIETLVNINDLILGIDEVSGLSATIKLELSGNTVSLIGKNGYVISSILVPGMNLTFSDTDTIELNNNDGDISANVKVDSDENNRITVTKNGIFSSRIINCGKY